MFSSRVRKKQSCKIGPQNHNKSKNDAEVCHTSILWAIERNGYVEKMVEMMCKACSYVKKNILRLQILRISTTMKTDLHKSSGIVPLPYIGFRSFVVKDISSSSTCCWSLLVFTIFHFTSCCFWPCKFFFISGFAQITHVSEI